MSQKNIILLHANCQGLWLSESLRLLPDVSEQYEVFYLPSHYADSKYDILANPEFLGRCSHFLWQTAAGCKDPDFVTSLPAHCRRLRFPALFLQWLWPCSAFDADRHVTEPGCPNGRYPYGDRLIMDLLAKGVPIEDLPARYLETDLNTILPIERFYQKCLATMRTNDADSDLASTPLVENTFRQRQTFACLNHPNPIILQDLVLLLAQAIVGRSELRAPSEPFDRADITGQIEIPIHPQVAAHFQLAWYRPDMTWRYGAEQLTLTDYVKAYGANRRIPHEGPEMWLRRTESALARQDYAEAERLLLKASLLHPEKADFLGRLGKMHSGLRNYLRAEKVLRYAIQQHPAVPALYNELGLVLQQRGFPEESLRAFHHACALDPQNPVLRQNFLHAARLAKAQQTKAMVSRCVA